MCEGFMGQARTTRVGLGLPNLPLCSVPGHVGVQTAEELRTNVLDHTLSQVIDALTKQPEPAKLKGEPGPRDIVFTGTLEEVDEFFYANEWSDGLPFVPPTLEKVEQFLRHTDRDANEVVGVILPDNRAATVWNVAVNGVMAGCRPEYMPVLLGIADALCDPMYGVEHSGNTPGSDAVIVLNGPIVKSLQFNYEQGVMRDGFRPNTTVGRFLRLFLRNVVGFILHKNDKACFGNTWRVAIAENEDVLTRIGWKPNSEEMGFRAGQNTVMIGRYTGGDVSVSASGDQPEQILRYVADSVLQQTRWQLVFTMGYSYGKLRPLVLLSPVLAETIAKSGWTKADVRQYLYDHTFISARKFDQYTQEYSSRHGSFRIAEHAKLGQLPPAYLQSDDPDRMVPIVFSPDNFIIIVTGDPGRTNFYTFVANGHIGYPTTMAIKVRNGA
jgi:hypothetical protein